MRNLERNKRTIYHARNLGETPILDDMGNDTLETRIEFSEPMRRRVNISSATGQDEVNTFGNMTEYSRIISTSETGWEIKEGDAVWFGIEPTAPHNYVVVRIADSLNTILIALKEVNISYED